MDHQRRIAYDTLMLSELGARLSGGPTLPEAIKFLRTAGIPDSVIKKRLRAAGHKDAEITDLFNRD
jgi:hypothetical protein